MLKNRTKNLIISSDVKYAEGLLDQIFGMILKRNSKGLIFKTRFGIHTFFMTKPIDVIILNNKKQVVNLKENLKPNRIFLWNPKYEVVVELPGGTIKRSETKLGDKIEIS